MVYLLIPLLIGDVIWPKLNTETAKDCELFLRVIHSAKALTHRKETRRIACHKYCDFFGVVNAVS